MTIRVVAHLQAKADKVDEAREVLRGLIAPTNQEPGCISYEMLENLDDPTQFTFVEEYQDGSALEAHFGTAHIGGLLTQFESLFAEELDLRKYSKVG